MKVVTRNFKKKLIKKEKYEMNWISSLSVVSQLSPPTKSFLEIREKCHYKFENCHKTRNCVCCLKIYANTIGWQKREKRIFIVSKLVFIYHNRFQNGKKLLLIKVFKFWRQCTSNTKQMQRCKGNLCNKNLISILLIGKFNTFFFL